MPGPARRVGGRNVRRGTAGGPLQPHDVSRYRPTVPTTSGRGARPLRGPYSVLTPQRAYSPNTGPSPAGPTPAHAHTTMSLVPEIVPPQFRAAVAKWGRLVDPAAKPTGLSGAEYLARTIDFETGGTWDPSIQNPDSGALGLGQFMEGTANSFRQQYGVEARDPRKPKQQIRASAMHLSGNYGHPALYAGYNPGYSDTDPILSRDSGRLVPVKVKGGMGGANMQLAGKRAADSAGWQGFQGGPKQVRTAIDVINPNKLNRWLTANGHDIEHLNPVFARHLIRLAKASGEPISVTSGYRSVEDQAAIDPGTNPKAPPGLSSHQFGMALDAAFTARQTQLAPRFGIEHGGAGPGVADPPHSELTDPRLIRKALKFAPIRSGYAPAGIPLSQGDLGNWTSAGVGAGVPAGTSGGGVGGYGAALGGGISGGGVAAGGAAGGAGGGFAPPAYPIGGSTSPLAAMSTGAQGLGDISGALEQLLSGAPPAAGQEDALAKILRGSRRFRPRR